MFQARVVIGLLMVAGCGRFGFDEHTSAPDAPIGDAMPDATPSMLTCGQPGRAELGSTDALTAFGTAAGLGLVTSTAGAIGGWTFDVLASGELVPGVQNVVLGTSETNQVGAAANGSTIVVSAIEGMPPTGTVLTTFGPAFATGGAPSHRADEFAVSGPLAPSAAGFAYVTQDATTHQVDARRVDSSGNDASTPIAIVPGGDKASEPELIATAHGYALAYVAAATSPNEARLELLDGNFNVVVAPVAASTSGYDPEHVTVSHAATSDTYLLTWTEKTATTDTVSIALLAGDLSVIQAGTTIATDSYAPTVATDGTGFWVVWQNGSTASVFLDGAHVDPTGAVTPRPVAMTGGSAAQWLMVERFGQPMLVWTQTGGSGPDLFVDPMCP